MIAFVTANGHYERRKLTVLQAAASEKYKEIGPGPERHDSAPSPEKI